MSIAFLPSFLPFFLLSYFPIYLLIILYLHLYYIICSFGEALGIVLPSHRPMKLPQNTCAAVWSSRSTRDIATSWGRRCVPPEALLWGFGAPRVPLWSSAHSCTSTKEKAIGTRLSCVAHHMHIHM